MAVVKKEERKKKSKYITSDGHSYLTKRIMVSRARAAGRVATANAMRVMGYVVIAQDDSIIKKYLDGRVEIITTI
jgi:hypothetical protein